MGVFDAFQIPYSAVEREHEGLIGEAAGAGAGTIIRGGVAKGVAAGGTEALERLSEPWRGRLQAKVDRWEQARLDDLIADAGMDAMEFMLRFTLSHPDLDTTIVGTANPKHFAANVAVARKGPLPPDVYKQAMERLSPSA
jgi:aryl-alcohol dehydrogenase-like predicted oxidoreductase